MRVFVTDILAAASLLLSLFLLVFNLLAQKRGGGRGTLFVSLYLAAAAVFQAAFLASSVELAAPWLYHSPVAAAAAVLAPLPALAPLLKGAGGGGND